MSSCGGSGGKLLLGVILTTSFPPPPFTEVSKFDPADTLRATPEDVLHEVLSSVSPPTAVNSSILCNVPVPRLVLRSASLLVLEEEGAEEDEAPPLLLLLPPLLVSGAGGAMVEVPGGEVERGEAVEEGRYRVLLVCVNGM